MTCELSGHSISRHNDGIILQPSPTDVYIETLFTQIKRHPIGSPAWGRRGRSSPLRLIASTVSTYMAWWHFQMEYGLMEPGSVYRLPESYGLRPSDDGGAPGLKQFSPAQQLLPIVANTSSRATQMRFTSAPDGRVSVGLWGES